MSSIRVLIHLAVVLVIAASALRPGAQDHARDRRRTPVVEVFEQNKDAVVNISSTQLRRIRDRFGLFDDDLFDRFFDFPIGRPRTVRQTSVGSGFVLHPAGFIVTNAHVVARAADCAVTFGDGREMSAEVIAMDVESDLAVLKVQADASLPTLKLGRSDDLMVGETVIAIGNPFGFQHTVTSGVVSALDRNIEVTERIHFKGLIQTDASINPGNSGGPLFNVLGELIGINTAIRHDAENIGFAIPVDQLKHLLPDLLSIERRDRVATGLRLDEAEGVVVREVVKESAADKAGLRANDLITEVDGRRVSDLLDFQIALLSHQPGDMVDLAVDRGGRRIITSLELQERPAPDGAKLAHQRLGLDVEEVALDDASILRITEVDRDGPAYSIDVRAGDFLIGINNEVPSNLKELGLLLESLKPGDLISFTFARVSRNFRHQQTVPLRVR